MGVMPCNRYQCDNIMCDRYSGLYGYICDECFNELIILDPDIDVEDFMKTEKGYWTPLKQSYDIFDAEFPMRD